MSATSWDREMADLAGRLGQTGAISPAQTELLQRLVAEVGSLAGARRSEQAIIVRVAVPLTPEEHSRLNELLARRFGASRRVSVEVDPEILGGVWLRVGDQIIDGSLRGRLDALHKQMSATQ